MATVCPCLPRALTLFRCLVPFEIKPDGFPQPRSAFAKKADDRFLAGGAYGCLCPGRTDGGDSVTVAPFWAFLPRSSELLYEMVALQRQRSICSHHVCDLKR